MRWQDDRFAQDQCEIDEEASELIVAAGEGHPRSTMLIAQQTHHASVEEGTHHIDGTLAERGYRGALAADAGRHADLMDRIRTMGRAAAEVSFALRTTPTLSSARRSSVMSARPETATRNAGAGSKE